LYTKDVANEPISLLVTHMTSFDIRINRYEFLKLDFDAEQILGRLTIQAFDQIFGPQAEWILLGSGYMIWGLLTRLSNA
jgi:hypothetical protein